MRSNARGALQAGGYLGLIIATGGLAVAGAGVWPPWVTAALLLLHGTCYAFQINAVHELLHGTVFRAAWANAAFVRVFAFLGWINYPLFAASHARHHQFTLHPPDDLEVVLPVDATLRRGLRVALVDPGYLVRMVREAWRLARGRFEGEWELALFPPESPSARAAPMRWARSLLAGHALLLVLSFAAAAVFDPRFALVPVVTTFGKCYGGWLFYACNNSQHAGMQSSVPDFRRCARTITVHPVVGFLYWHMNFHVDHHMYTQVPCYRLAQLHRAIRHDLPHVHHGLLPTWREIDATRALQSRDPEFRHDPFASRCACGGGASSAA